MKTTWEAKVKTYRTAGKMTWETIKTFDNPGTADAWLCSYIKENHYIASDFRISRVER